MFNKAETITKEPCLSLDNSAEQQVVKHKWPAILGLYIYNLCDILQISHNSKHFHKT